MKSYVKPQFSFIELRSEERLAGSGGGCTFTTGTCGIPDPITGEYPRIYQGLTGE